MRCEEKQRHEARGLVAGGGAGSRWRRRAGLALRGWRPCELLLLSQTTTASRRDEGAPRGRERPWIGREEVEQGAREEDGIGQHVAGGKEMGSLRSARVSSGATGLLGPGRPAHQRGLGRLG